MSHLEVETEHQSESAEAAARTDLLRVHGLLRVNRLQLFHLLQLEQQELVTIISTESEPSGICSVRQKGKETWIKEFMLEI